MMAARLFSKNVMKLKHVLWTVFILAVGPLLFEKKAPTQQDLEEDFFTGAFL